MMCDSLSCREMMVVMMVVVNGETEVVERGRTRRQSGSAFVQRVNMRVAEVCALSNPLLAAGPAAPVMESMPKSLPSLSEPRPILLVGQGESPPPGLEP